jgi:uncharacterized protein
MKILAFTDTHGSNTALKKVKATVKKEEPDIIVCCGDFTIFENGMKNILKLINELGQKVLLIHGNHEEPNTVKKMLKNCPNIMFLHKKTVRIGNVFFMGWGGGGFSVTEPEFKRWSEQAVQKAKQGDEIVLVTHGPPYGVKQDSIGGDHCGNKDYAVFIKKRKMGVALCGHIHETFCTLDTLGKFKNKVVNPGPVGALIEL